jgi:hydrogenase maturation protease
MPHTLIIGYGNPLRSDDGIGPRAAELLADEALAPSVDVLICHQLTLELAELIAQADRLILIDATAVGEPGAVQQQTLAPAIPAGATLTHHIDAQGLLAAAQMLFGRAPETVLFTASGSCFDAGETLSPAVTAALPDLLARIREAVLS